MCIVVSVNIIRKITMTPPTFFVFYILCFAITYSSSAMTPFSMIVELETKTSHMLLYKYGLTDSDIQPLHLNDCNNLQENDSIRCRKTFIDNILNNQFTNTNSTEQNSQRMEGHLNLNAIARMVTDGVNCINTIIKDIGSVMEPEDESFLVNMQTPKHVSFVGTNKQGDFLKASSTSSGYVPRFQNQAKLGGPEERVYSTFMRQNTNSRADSELSHQYQLGCVKKIKL